jgi:hypothetical protein
VDMVGCQPGAWQLPGTPRATRGIVLACATMMCAQWYYTHPTPGFPPSTHVYTPCTHRTPHAHCDRNPSTCAARSCRRQYHTRRTMVHVTAASCGTYKQRVSLHPSSRLTPPWSLPGTLLVVFDSSWVPVLQRVHGLHLDAADATGTGKCPPYQRHTPASRHRG